MCKPSQLWLNAIDLELRGRTEYVRLLIFLIKEKQKILKGLLLTMAEKLCLQWNDLKDNVKTAFGNLRGDTDFTDVTLACEDGKQVRAHKVILAASSPTLQKILRKNQHPQPSMIYMRGLKSEDLKAMIDLIYFGEANVFQENLDSFLALAEELQLKGLTEQDAGQTKEQEVKFRETVVSEPKNPENTDFSHMENNVILPRTVKENIGKTVALTRIDTEGIEELAKSLMEKTSSATPDGKRPLY